MEDKFIGFIIFDKDNFASVPPCYSVEGDNINNKLSNLVSDTV